MDHQWGDFTTLGIGWDWLSLNLDDGSDLTVSVVWELEGHKPISTYGTYVPADASAIHLPGHDICAGFQRNLDQPCHRCRLPHTLEVAESTRWS